MTRYAGPAGSAEGLFRRVEKFGEAVPRVGADHDLLQDADADVEATCTQELIVSALQNCAFERPKGSSES